MKLEQGVVYVAADPNTHVVVDRWPAGSIRLLPRDPVKGFRPSADLLLPRSPKPRRFARRCRDPDRHG